MKLSARKAGGKEMSVQNDDSFEDRDPRALVRLLHATRIPASKKDPRQVYKGAIYVAQPPDLTRPGLLHIAACSRPASMLSSGLGLM